MKTPEISVIVPVYRGEAYLRKCLDSIESQTYGNLEVILVDDGSPDGCGVICDGYAARDARVRVIHKENGGVSSARNAGLEAASGEWIGFLDADDWVEPDFYEELLGLAVQYGADIVQSGLVYETGGEREVRFAPEEPVCRSKGVLVYPETGRPRYSNNVSNKIYRAEALKGIRFHSGFPIGEDLLFNLKALEHSGAVVMDSRAKYHYIQHSESVCHAEPDRKRLTSYREALSFAGEEFAAYPGMRGFLWREYLRNDLDICSKIVRFRLDWAEDLVREIQAELRREMGGILREQDFSGKEKVKFMAILSAFPVYRLILPHWKKWFGERSAI